MAALHFRLFGQFGGTYDGNVVESFGSAKAAELLCYILLNRDRPQSRELIASILWEHATTAQSKAYLRKALWQLQSALRSQPSDHSVDLLSVSTDYIAFNRTCDTWLDVDAFEKAYDACKGVAGEDLDQEQATRLCEAVDLYDGDLLEDWFQEWCLYERERYRHLHFGMLDKLVTYHETHLEYEPAMLYAERILYHDRAREYTHRQLMRLRHAIGDRTGAVRQYESCEWALNEDLDIEPSIATRRLYERITANEPIRMARPGRTSARSAHEVLHELKSAINLLAEAHDRLRRDILALEEQLQAAETPGLNASAPYASNGRS